MNQQPAFYITHLYPKEMNIYGDMGNVIAMQYRLKKLGIKPIYQPVNIGEKLPQKTDWYFIGGGQDNDQMKIVRDLQSKQSKLFQDIINGVGLLAICGGYQLLGKKFITGDGEVIPGLGLFAVETQAPGEQVKQRCIGNLVTSCLIPGLSDTKLVGFENHSGQTEFVSGVSADNQHPLGEVNSGFGNNANQEHEGCVFKNAVGTYLHGSCLPKNPDLANWFIQNQLARKSITKKIDIDDTIAKKVNMQLQSF